VKYQTTPAFDADVKRLSRTELETFREVVRSKFIPAAEHVAGRPGSKWPASLRVKDVENAPGVWEMTWSFSGPDGRATFEWAQVDDEPAIRWRRVGGHAIFGDP
jgi:hypothetical protein